MEDEEGGMWVAGDGVHTADFPYCDDITCWCHTDIPYHEVVTQCGDDAVSDETLLQGYAFFGLDG